MRMATEKINFGGQERQFLFSVYITSVFSDRFPSDILTLLRQDQIMFFLKVGMVCLEEGDKDLPKDFDFRMYCSWWDEAPKSIKQQIKRGIRKVYDLGGAEDDIMEQFKALVESMTDEERAKAKKIIVDGLPKNGKGAKSPQVPERGAK